ncbi:MAG TPA: pirin family protein [Xanthobacteraceae bacterium]|nr:pirin family protein [Xanthobacteraceae bacterium]
MSWMPGQDPILGDKHSCNALELIIVPRARDLGDGFSVHRALPHARRQMVGPFIFFDQMGPVQYIDGRGAMDVRPHPHIGLATVTYLFQGSIMHRDSEGNALEITPGAMNLMTAGRGIAHSERTPGHDRMGRSGMFGIQSWIALPQAHEEITPLFEHFDAADLPVIDDGGLRARIIAGAAFGKRAPVGMVSEWFYAEVLLDAGARAPLDPDHEERAIYVAEGEVDIAGEKFASPQLLVFRPGDRIMVTATKPSRLMFLGGTALEGPRYIWWNFVSSRKERIEQAKEEWKSGKFALIPGDDKEFIPLPEH